MMTAMANGTLLGVRYPKSLAAAYMTTANYVVPPEKMKKSAGSSASTYLTNDESNDRGGRGAATGRQDQAPSHTVLRQSGQFHQGISASGWVPVGSARESTVRTPRSRQTVARASQRYSQT